MPVPTVTASIENLVGHIVDDHDSAAATDLARKLLEKDPPPASFTEFIELVKLEGKLTPVVFNLVSDAFDRVRHEIARKALEDIKDIPTLGEDPS